MPFTPKLRYCMNTAIDLKEIRHPQTVMKELGITYEAAEPYPIADCWIFYNCSNVPEVLPE